MSSLLRILLATVAALTIAACGLTKGKAAATKAVDTFHQQFNDSEFTAIYSASTSAFKSAAREPDFMAFIQAVRRKLGAFKSGTQTSWNVSSVNGVTTVVLKYQSQFDQGSATETFTYLTFGETATLQGYNINTPVLIIN